MATNKKNKKKATVITLVLFLIFAIVAYFILGDYVQRQIYPLKYEDTIKKMSQKYDLDPYLVCAVIYAESKFDEDAVSSAGAVGLMQLLPDTGEWIAEKLSISGYSEESLKNATINIELGCWYLNYLSKKFDGDITSIVAGYNAGPNKVNSWLKDKTISSDGKTLTNIPYKETDNYVKRITSAYDKYKSLYKDSFN